MDWVASTLKLFLFVGWFVFSWFWKLEVQGQGTSLVGEDSLPGLLDGQLFLCPYIAGQERKKEREERRKGGRERGRIVWCLL